ncbi:two-component sensor histidine kinase [Clostridium thermosuccinogenes]|jgi:signal transduction histidine kinase|uniref:histidine kinase n=1 Tax=Clostridium thermosuccinogenes TaxID=84032 RepID=A0A2K2FBD5_9CLOT|nr:HAMP domain-containing sensor histidine kinase [Pseudoclostridium thermosuccinogenes]AUS97026.1 two-component sensor histidine kinase [Pseudoclostridium thermosuccinogenes]PNT92303.1 two-component sensor histidine kinase [Pseudoclostridium thermosuccinogenes]PNT96100.1 two-component sensor histidine kinase [Pseudoclostridium thermosuccinogenes]PNT97711.1 two-component sensor histidine kinase [Pseudoclostridium thermosuccinogenes]
MAFFRNGEIRILLVSVSIISAILIAGGFVAGVITGFFVLLSVFLLCLVFFLFTAWRYRHIAKLSQYLRRISAGEYSLDIRDNREGELSILKSEIYKVTLMLSQYNEQLKKEKLLLSSQMADISHQLKTPLTSMMVMADLLRDEKLPEEKRREFTSHIHAQLERIEWLVSSLLKMSKLDAGVLEMNPREISARTLIEKALSPLLISMEIKDISYSITGEDRVIKCDLQWTAEALINILKNCIEHTPEGGRIDISIQDNPLYSEIKIADNGPGISKEDLPHIFTRFYRGKNASPDSVGIGLAMSLSIIRNQQGDITVESKPGQGSTFFIRLYKSVI